MADSAPAYLSRLNPVRGPRFQMLFAAIAPLLMTGAFAERLRFWPAFGLLVGWEALVYYPVAHWSGPAPM